MAERRRWRAFVCKDDCGSGLVSACNPAHSLRPVTVVEEHPAEPKLLNSEAGTHAEPQPDQEALWDDFHGRIRHLRNCGFIDNAAFYRVSEAFRDVLAAVERSHSEGGEVGLE
jgi:hypothetical protein